MSNTPGKEDDPISEESDPSAKKNRPFKWRYNSSGKNSPSKFTVYSKAEVPCDVTISREGWSHQAAKKYGVSKEIQTGDPAFDKEYYIDTYAPVFAASFLWDSYKRDAINEIMKAGFHSVQLRDSTVSAVKSPASFENDEAMETLASSVGLHVVRLTENIPMASQAEIKAKKTGLGKLVALYAVPFSLCIFGWLPLYMAMENHRPISDMPVILDTVKYSIAVLAMFMWVAYILLRGTSSAGGQLIKIFFISIFSFLFSGWGVVMYVNGVMDENPQVSSRAKVTHMYEYYAKNNSTPSYYMRVSSWREDLDEIEIQIDASLYNQL
ncbi:MAG: hypothetical protein OEZ32_05015, partial [Nitrospinota bacterium]|nr:hypothetical protein [Nitrospinota bacterium]